MMPKHFRCPQTLEGRPMQKVSYCLGVMQLDTRARNKLFRSVLSSNSFIWQKASELALQSTPPPKQ